MPRARGCVVPALALCGTAPRGSQRSPPRVRCIPAPYRGHLDGIVPSQAGHGVCAFVRVRVLRATCVCARLAGPRRRRGVGARVRVRVLRACVRDAPRSARPWADWDAPARCGSARRASCHRPAAAATGRRRWEGGECMWCERERVDRCCCWCVREQTVVAAGACASEQTYREQLVVVHLGEAALCERGLVLAHVRLVQLEVRPAARSTHT